MIRFKPNVFRGTVLLAAAVQLALVTAAAPARAADNEQAKPTTADAEKIARGKYIVTVSGCNDCHTPWKVRPNGPEPDMSRMLSGHPENFALPPAPRPTPPPASAPSRTFSNATLGEAKRGHHDVVAAVRASR